MKTNKKIEIQFDDFEDILLILRNVIDRSINLDDIECADHLLWKYENKAKKISNENKIAELDFTRRCYEFLTLDGTTFTVLHGCFDSSCLNEEIFRLAKAQKQIDNGIFTLILDYKGE